MTSPRVEPYPRSAAGVQSCPESAVAAGTRGWNRDPARVVVVEAGRTRRPRQGLDSCGPSWRPSRGLLAPRTRGSWRVGAGGIEPPACCLSDSCATAAPRSRRFPSLVGKGGVAPPPLAHETGVLLVELLPVGWSTGLEPTPPESQPGALPFELRPQCPARDSNAQPLASQASARPSSCQGIWVNPWGDAAATQPVTGRNYVGQVWRDAPRIHRFGGPGSPPFRCDHSAVVNVPRVAR